MPIVRSKGPNAAMVAAWRDSIWKNCLLGPKWPRKSLGDFYLNVLVKLQVNNNVKYSKRGWRGLTRCRGGGLHPRSSDRSCKGCPNQTSARYTTKCRARAAPEAGPATSDRRPNPLAEKIAYEDQIDSFVVNPAALRDGAWDSGLLAVETHVQEIDSAEICRKTAGVFNTISHP